MQTIPMSSYQKSLSFRLLSTRLREAWMSYSQMLQPKCSWKTLQLGSTASESGDHRRHMQFRGRWTAVRKGTDLHLPGSRHCSHNLQCFGGSMPTTAGSGPPGPWILYRILHTGGWIQSTERRNSTSGSNYHKQDANPQWEACKLTEQPYTQHAGGPKGTFENVHRLPLLKNMEAIWPISTLSVISKILAELRLSAS